MTNPNDAVGTNGAYGGRTSVNAFNDLAGAFTRGVVSGWACVPNTGLTVSLGGDGTNRDVAIAMDNIGDKTTINNISGAPIDVTIDSAPVSNSRIDLIVAYVDNPPQGTDTVADNPSACGLIVVKGVASASPTPPSDGNIRSAITADGASGTNAYYVILAQITIASGTTTLTSSNISNGSKATLNNSNLPTIGAGDIDLTTFVINPKFIQTGTGNITYQVQGSAGGGVTVNFSPAFDHAPIFIASTKGPYSANVVEIHAQSASTTSCAVLGRTAGGASESGQFQWVAIDLLANPIKNSI